MQNNSLYKEIQDLKARLEYLETQIKQEENFESVIKRTPFPASNIRYSQSKRVKQLRLCRHDPEQSATNLTLDGPSATMIMWLIDRIVELENSEKKTELFTLSHK